MFAMLEIRRLKILRRRDKMHEVEPQELANVEELTHTQHVEVDMKMVSSPVLTRLIEEIRNNAVSDQSVYNRVHNRHNRS